MNRMRLLLLCLASVPLFCHSAAAAPILAQKPTLSATHIAFVTAGDLWSVARDGGEAVRLTTGTGIETNPQFSPDGKWIAFTGSYDGNTDVFIIPAAGGVPKRITYHPAPDFVQGWTPDGKRIVFTSPRNSYSRFGELYTASLEGGLEEKLPLPTGYEASYSADGSRIAYVPVPKAFSAWKHYRGGRTTPIWIAALSDSRVEPIPRENSNDFNPVWVGEKVYFLSDRDGTISLFSYDTKSKKVAKAAANTGLDFKSASAGPGAIVIEQFGGLLLYDLKSGKVKLVNVTLAGDMPEVRPRLANVSKRLTNAHISPTGARAVFEARGEIITVPAEKGDARNVTGSPGFMDRDPAWSPDGKWIAYFSDAAGEYDLYIIDSLGKGPAQKIRLEDKPTFYTNLGWSPDSKKLSYLDAHLNIWFVDVEQKKPVKVDTDRIYGDDDDRAPVWSPDSKWLSYSKRLKNSLGAIFVYSLADAKSTQVTDGLSDARYQVFDKGGKYLYFAAGTDSGPALEQDLHSGRQAVTKSIYLTVLSKTEPSPFAPESDEEKAADSKDDSKKDEAKKDEAKKDESKKDAKPEAPKTPDVKIDFDKIGQRILAMPLPTRRYTGLQAGKAGTLFVIEAGASGPQQGPPPGATVHRYDLKLRKSDVVASGVRFFEVSANGEKTLTAQQDRWSIQSLKPMTPGPAGGPPSPAPPAGGPGGGANGVLKTADLEVKVDPRAEWKQMFIEGWRIEREFFYDPNLHGVNLAEITKRYEPYLEAVMSREDLNYLFEEMMGELTVGHLYVGGGDQPDVKSVPTGLLGCDFAVENGRYRFTRIFDGENWNPDLKAPLTQPGVNVQPGEYLLAVNGRDLSGTDNVYSFFEATAGKSVVLKVGPTPDGANSREVTVTPVTTESRLRHLAWIEDNRRKVDAATGGKVAYVYMPDTSFGGLTNFTRYFYAQVDKSAAIIDERFNGGGALATDIVEILNRNQIMSLVAMRDGEDFVQPHGAIFGPKVMIINGFAGSGGDAMPWYFKRTGAGKLIGTRTWGGLVGIFGVPSLMDGGFLTAPNAGVWNPNGHWEVENVGIAPDVEVEQDPALVRQGKDPQLDKAVEVVMAELAKTQPVAPKRPAYPNYHAK